MYLIAYISANEAQDANAALEAEGYGPGNFFIPVSGDGTEPASGYMLSWANGPELSKLLGSDSLRTFSDHETTFEDAKEKLGVQRIEYKEPE